MEKASEEQRTGKCECFLGLQQALLKPEFSLCGHEDFRDLVLEVDEVVLKKLPATPSAFSPLPKGYQHLPGRALCRGCTVLQPHQILLGTVFALNILLLTI